MKGRRVYVNADGFLPMEEGDYGQDADDLWWARCPGARAGAALVDHTIEEHEDGTITCSPSLLIPGFYHGHLVRGDWSESTE